MTTTTTTYPKTILGFRLPNAYVRKQDFGTERCYKRRDGLMVIEGVGMWDMPDGTQREFMHVSMSFADHLPSYEDMKQVKAIFIGEAFNAYQVFPSKGRHVNIMPYCLHLWSPLEDECLPDFGAFGTI